MSKGMTPQERTVKIELLRARAALERQSMLGSVRGLSQSLKPRSLVHSMFPRATSRSLSDWIYQAVTLTRRYPLLTSTVSAMLSSMGKKRRLWRVAAGLLLTLHVSRAMTRRGD